MTLMPLTLADFTTDLFDDEPRITDWRLAESLILDNRWFHQLIERHREDLEDFGTLWHRTTKSSGGRPGSEYRLNFNQAIYIINRSEAKNAKPVQKHVVIIYGLWATGKLRPVDAATGTAIAVATAQTLQESPIVMGMLQGLLDQILNGQGDLNNRVESVQRTAYEIQERLGEIVKRGKPTEKNIEIYDRVLGERYADRCPCCGKHLLIVDGKHTDLYETDHATDHPGKSLLQEMWPVCKYDNRKFKNPNRYPNYRADTMDAFRKFQRHVTEILGERLI